MKNKTKFTITIDSGLLKDFNDTCEKKSINKSKLTSSMIKKWVEVNSKSLIENISDYKTNF